MSDDVSGERTADLDERLKILARTLNAMKLGDWIGPLVDARNELSRLSSALAAAEGENTRLRAALAQSERPCVYCSLPAEEWAKCKSGFPGCARADDAMGCPELGARQEVEALTAQLQNSEARVAVLSKALNKTDRAHFHAETCATQLFPNREPPCDCGHDLIKAALSTLHASASAMLEMVKAGKPIAEYAACIRPEASDTTRSALGLSIGDLRAFAKAYAALRSPPSEKETRE